MKSVLFWIFGILQSTALGFIIFLNFRALGKISGDSVIGMDANITLSIVFPLFLLIVEYLIYSGKK